MMTLRRIAIALRSAFSGKAGLLRVLVIASFSLALLAAAPNAAEACGISDPASCVALIFVKIFQLLTALMGWILVLEVEAVIRVAQYFNFVSPGPGAVRIGWIVTRDVANMFFIVILLIIAFGTILGSATYNYEKNLPRLLIMAVVINFSKTICGIFIDMGQVVMLTFVNGFKEAAAGNFMNAYQINKLVALGQSQTGTYDFGMVIAMMFAFVLAAIAVCVTLVLLVTLLFRVVMLWVLIILSPIAFLSSAIPRGGDYYADWWKEFRKYIITGPVIAFFMWLALASVQTAGQAGFSGEQAYPAGGFPPTYAGTGEKEAALGAAQSRIPTEAGRADTIMNMVIAICIMLAGLKYAEKSGVAGVGTAKMIRDRATRAGRAIATYGAKRAAEPFLTGAGKQLAKVPLVGGLGRAAVLQGEKWKKERQAGRERFAGTPEDMARLSPSAFARKVGGLKDPKEIDRFMSAAKGNPAAMAALTKTSTSTDPLYGTATKSSAAKDVLNNLVAAGRGDEAAKLISGDKRLGDLAKADPDLLGSVYGGFKSAADKNPNLKKDVGAFETKFLASLLNKDSNGNTLLGNVGIDDKLKEMAPKISGEDLSGLDEKSVAALTPYLTGGQMKKIMQDGKLDQMGGLKGAVDKMDAEAFKKFANDKGIGAGDMPTAWYGDAKIADFVLDKTRGDAKSRGDVMDKGGAALSTRANARYEQALAAGDAKATVAALPDAVSIGSLKADGLLNNPTLRGFVDNNAGGVDLASMARGSGRMSADQKQAAQALAAMVSNADPDRAKRMRGEMYQDIRPSPEMMKRVSGEEKAAEVSEALAGFTKALEDAKQEISSLEDLASAPGQASGGSQAALTQLQQTVQSLERSSAALASAQKEKTALEVRIKNTPASDTAGTAALKKSLGEIEKTLEKTQQEIVKGMAALKKG